MGIATRLINGTMTEAGRAMRMIVDAAAPDAAVIARAAAIVRDGGLVAFPTETVYGLGASALDAAAVARIFEAKGRPSNNPIIVHVADVDGARQLVADWPDIASALAAQFWPGPLTLVLQRNARIPDIVTAGGPTVAIRVPSHPVALALIRAAGVPIAAPSANRSERLSPTTADHVAGDLDGRIDAILDGGPCPGGLESTVLDLTTTPPRILRPGLITPTDLAAIIGKVDAPAAVPNAGAAEPARSPGMLARHYAPRARVVLRTTASELLPEPTATGVGWLRLDGWQGNIAPPNGTRVIDMPGDATAYAARLYAALHELDRAGVDVIVVDVPPDSDDETWASIRDRLTRAACQPAPPPSPPAASIDAVTPAASPRGLGEIAASPQSARAWSAGTAGGWFVRLGRHGETLSVRFPLFKGTPQIDGVLKTSRSLGAVLVTTRDDEPIGRVQRWKRFTIGRGAILTDAHGLEVARVRARPVMLWRAVIGVMFRRQPVWLLDLLVDGARVGGITVGYSLAYDATLTVVPRAAEWIDGRLLLAALLVCARDATWCGMPTYPLTSIRRYDELLGVRRDAREVSQ